MGRLFGTDGIRGIANEDLNCSLAYRVGRAVAYMLTREGESRPVVLIGKDTRASSDMLEAALAAGITASGADALPVGVIPTPAVAYLTSRHASAGVVISASHNPYQYNGIKIFNRDGYKLSDEIEDDIERLMSSEPPAKTGADIGRVLRCGELGREYVGHIREAAHGDFGRLKVLVDCANGAASVTAQALLSPLAFNRLDFINNRPDGKNINDNCGSTSLQCLQNAVIEGGYDVGIAFDGDADRCLAVDENGAAVDGDRILALCGMREAKMGRLAGNAIVATVMSNLGLHVWAEEKGIRLLTAPVGDRYVLEMILKGGYSLGGEQSGHIIFSDYSTTGDGQLTAVKLLSLIAESGGAFSQLHGEIPRFPQVLLNIDVSPEIKAAVVENERVKAAVDEAAGILGVRGRVLVRPSGTENLVRVMVEGEKDGEIKIMAQNIAKIIESI